MNSGVAASTFFQNGSVANGDLKTNLKNRRTTNVVANAENRRRRAKNLLSQVKDDVNESNSHDNVNGHVTNGNSAHS